MSGGRRLLDQVRDVMRIKHYRRSARKATLAPAGRTDSRLDQACAGVDETPSRQRGLRSIGKMGGDVPT